MFTEAYMLRALAVALMLGPLCGLLGVFVTARRLAFFSDTVAHSALAGVAIGVWLGLTDPTLPMVGVSLGVALLLLWLKEKTALLTDTLLALLLSTSVAFGVVVFRLQKGYRADLERYLFGDILSVSPTEVWVTAIIAIVVAAALFSRFNALTLLTAHEELAHVSGVRVRALNIGFVLALTVVVALSIRLVGIVLVTSLLVVPAATARNLSHTLRRQLLLSVTAGLASAAFGVGISYPLNLPCGPAIVLACATLFVGSVAVRQITGFHRREKREAGGSW
jgi:ABC-type Mn2+/Zn2+ transport system permease subunit